MYKVKGVVKRMNKVNDLINEMIAYYDGDVKRINHWIKVHSFAKIIGEMEHIDDSKQEILEVTAIVHDIGIKVSEQKYNSSAAKYQQIEGPVLAEELLRKLEFDESIISRVSFLVGHHHTYHAIDDIDFQILIEADFLVNIYEDDMNQDAVMIIGDKHFKTTTGTAYLEMLYLRSAR